MACARASSTPLLIVTASYGSQGGLSQGSRALGRGHEEVDEIGLAGVDHKIGDRPRSAPPAEHLNLTSAEAR
jgi:hypothetical protein